MKKVATILLCITLIYAFVGCNNPETKSGTSTAYGVTTGSCPFSVKIKSDGDGKILEVEFNEYLSVYDMGKTENGKKYGVEIGDTVEGYAHYVKVGDKVFTYENGYVCDNLVGTDKRFESFVGTAEGAIWYIRQVKEGDFDLVDENGNSYGVKFDTYDGYKLDKKEWADKMKNGFHEGEEYDHGWKEDMYSLATHLKNHGFYGYNGSEMPQGNQKTYKVGKYDTLVSLENFHDYMRVSQKAYEEARNNVK